MRWTPNELFYELGKDIKRRVLFVEGNRDLSFWNVLAPPGERNSGAIYSISALVSSGGVGGERGRMIRSAETFLNTPISDRVRFFADADYDRLLGRNVPSNVILTDGRDLEGYTLSEPCLERICRIGFPSSTCTGASLLNEIHSTVRAIGALRATSNQLGLEMPFAKTFERDFVRFITKDDQGVASLDIRHLIRVLMQNGGESLKDLDSRVQMHDQAVIAFGQASDDQLVHGKDLVRFLAWRFGVSVEEMERHIFMSVLPDVLRIRERANIGAATEWLKG